ncbi:hypothetical protein BDF19DRAFT_419841 [Syncephalis fuscata]|nr:hypothetical protein BDF19DRAFT_419841 [Syncephalis fuscata]
MDVNWCVVCDRHFDDNESTLYCSEACRFSDLRVELESGSDTAESTSPLDKDLFAVTTTGTSSTMSSNVLPLKNTTGFITTPDFCAHRRARSLSNRMPLPDLRRFGVMPTPVPVRTSQSSETSSSNAMSTAVGSTGPRKTLNLLRSASVPKSSVVFAYKKDVSAKFYATADSGFTTAESSPLLSEDEDDIELEGKNNNAQLDSNMYKYSWQEMTTPLTRPCASDSASVSSHAINDANTPIDNFDLSGLGVCTPQLASNGTYHDPEATLRLSKWQTTQQTQKVTTPNVADWTAMEQWLQTPSWHISHFAVS